MNDEQQYFARALKARLEAISVDGADVLTSTLFPKPQNRRWPRFAAAAVALVIMSVVLAPGADQLTAPYEVVMQDRQLQQAYAQGASEKQIQQLWQQRQQALQQWRGEQR